MQKDIIFMLLVMCTGAIVIAGCTSTGTMNTTTPATTVPATPVVYATTTAPATPVAAPEPAATMNQSARIPATTMTAVPAISIQPTIINSAGEAGWVSYTDPYDGFSMYTPTDWNLSPSAYPGDPVWVTSQDGREVIVITNETWLSAGQNSTVSANPAHEPTTEISDDVYTTYIRNITSPGYFHQFRIISVTKDQNFYQINGNPARHLSIMVQYGSSAPASLDGYLISSGNSWYSEYWGAGNEGISPGPSQMDHDTALAIVKTFTTTAVSTPVQESGDQSLGMVVHYG